MELPAFLEDVSERELAVVCGTTLLALVAFILVLALNRRSRQAGGAGGTRFVMQDGKNVRRSTRCVSAQLRGLALAGGRRFETGSSVSLPLLLLTSRPPLLSHPTRPRNETNSARKPTAIDDAVAASPAPTVSATSGVRVLRERERESRPEPPCPLCSSPLPSLLLSLPPRWATGLNNRRTPAHPEPLPGRARPPDAQPRRSRLP